jgi:fido (protein-threonine AMPylation protein)
MNKQYRTASKIQLSWIREISHRILFKIIYDPPFLAGYLRENKNISVLFHRSRNSQV